jgi:hypothetical protein
VGLEEVLRWVEGVRVDWERDGKVDPAACVPSRVDVDLPSCEDSASRWENACARALVVGVVLAVVADILAGL